MTTTMPASACAVLEEARQAHVAIEPLSGPHITPALYAWSGRRLWMAGAVNTLKAKTLARSPIAAVSVAVSGRTVIMQGPVQVVDPSRPTSLITSIGRLPALVRALAWYGVRNAPDLLAFGADLGRGRLGLSVPPMRAVFSLTPASGALLEDGKVTSTWGGWDVLASTPNTMPAADERSVVIAVPGPVALPALATPTGDGVRLAAGLDSLLPTSPSFPIAWVADEYVAPGPSAKQGLLGRGTAHRTDTPTLLRLELDRVVEWSGVDTSTIVLDGG